MKSKFPRKWRWMFKILMFTFRLVMKIIKKFWPKK